MSDRRIIGVDNPDGKKSVKRFTLLLKIDIQEMSLAYSCLQSLILEEEPEVSTDQSIETFEEPTQKGKQRSQAKFSNLVSFTSNRG